MPFLSLARVIDRGFQILDYRQKMYLTSEPGIENQAHWTLDVTLAEDASRIRSFPSPRNASSLAAHSSGSSVFSTLSPEESHKFTCLDF
jgi:hypothetical protein